MTHINNNEYHTKNQKDMSLSEIRESVVALSFRQPFASAMLINKVDTRTWSTKYRGLVLISSSTKIYTTDEVENISGTKLRDDLYSKMDDFENHPNYKGQSNYEYHGGIAIAIANLVDCRPMKPEDEEITFVKFSPNLFCHFYSNVCQIEPFKFRVKHRWQRLTDEQKASIVLI